MIRLLRRVLERRGDVARFQVRVVRKDFLVTCPCGEQIQDILHADAQATDAGTPSALLGTNGDAV